MSSRYEQYTTHHTSRRTKGWDYTQPAGYFVTICTQDRLCLFGEVSQGRLALNMLGLIVVEEWKRSEDIRERVHLDRFVVMPNHLHGIVVFADPDVEVPIFPRGYRAFGNSTPSTEAPPSQSGITNEDQKASTGGSTLGRKTDDPGQPNGENESNETLPAGPCPRSLGSFIAGFKSAATSRINDLRDTPGASVWQRNYHDVIIRTEEQWRAARQYIRRNPAKWHSDFLND